MGKDKLLQELEKKQQQQAELEKFIQKLEKQRKRLSVTKMEVCVCVHVCMYVRVYVHVCVCNRVSVCVCESLEDLKLRLVLNPQLDHFL